MLPRQPRGASGDLHLQDHGARGDLESGLPLELGSLLSDVELIEKPFLDLAPRMNPHSKIEALDPLRIVGEVDANEPWCYLVRVRAFDCPRGRHIRAASML